MNDIQINELMTKGFFKGDMERVTLEQAWHKYPNCWVLLVNCTYAALSQILSGEVYEVCLVDKIIEREEAYIDEHSHANFKEVLTPEFPETLVDDIML